MSDQCGQQSVFARGNLEGQRRGRHLDHRGVFHRVGVGDDAAAVDHEPSAGGTLLLESLPGHRPARKIMSAVDLRLQHGQGCDT